MTSLWMQHLDPPASARRMRSLESLRQRAVDELGGRTVWCAAAVSSGQASARRLQTFLQWGGGGGVACGSLEVAADEQLRSLAERLEAMLDGDAPSQLGGAEREICAEAVRRSEDLVGAVGPDDVVVVHDALTALLAQALRERGAHAVWNVTIVAPAHEQGASAARTFLRSYTSPMDAYVMTWAGEAAHGAQVERIAALMPSADVVAAKEIPMPYADGEPRLLGWSTVLADVVHGDRDESVGGTLRPRPAVPMR
ncbi:MAG: hypothetical protein QOI62_400 [Solirubrobacteraceae bacterium]|jgi:hypothetical protein|nr:hypothetical protein [Solirubrobacteraceae bacterium]MEA2357140.1 hypothetical protein [Solirubrobacteraceae bacterium]MEA2395392.1 hypothetical protein [Solirubrobacteraceae bacterium]